MTTPKTVNLSIGERVAALGIMNSFKGKLEVLRALLDDVKPIAITEEEWTTAKLEKKPNADGTESWTWDELVVNKDITFQKESVDYILSAIKAKNDAGEITIQDANLLKLQDKLQ